MSLNLLQTKKIQMTKSSLWIIILIGISGLFSSVYEFLKGEDFNTYFWSGFLGFVLIGTALIDYKRKNKV